MVGEVNGSHRSVMINHSAMHHIKRNSRHRSGNQVFSQHLRLPIITCVCMCGRRKLIQEPSAGQNSEPLEPNPPSHTLVLLTLVLILLKSESTCD
jgi:hypothetical protein